MLAQSPTRVDEKDGSRSLEFKRVIDEKYGTQFYITSLDGKHTWRIPSRSGSGSSRRRALDLQPGPLKKRSAERELLGASGRDGRPGSAADAYLLRRGADQGRSSSNGKPDAPGSAQPRSGIASEKIEEQEFTAEDEKTLDELGIIYSVEVQQTPSGGWAWQCGREVGHVPVLLKEAIDFSYRARRDVYRRYSGPGRAQFRNRKAPRRTGSFDRAR